MRNWARIFSLFEKGGSVSPYTTAVISEGIVLPRGNIGGIKSVRRRGVFRVAGNAMEGLHFDNLALRILPIDSVRENYVRRVAGACFSRVKPTAVKNPVTVAYSLPAMELLDVSESECQRPEFPLFFSGNRILPGSETAAHCYCGHQFGYFSGQLGDGAAMYLGEVINSKGERWEIQLKGAGMTPYSRSADGRKVLRSSIREFLCSEAMYHLGIPTTRAGSCVTSDSKVIRDIFYDGHPIEEKCTIVLRIASTFIRFGSFEIVKPIDTDTGRIGPSVGRKDILETLLNYVVETFYPEIYSSHEDWESRYLSFYKEIVTRTAQLVAEWQCVGFCHGVLNTDNMSIVGITIDYGPFGFMDRFNPDHICNGSDDGGRYSYIRQPEICAWNLKKLAEALNLVLPKEKSLKILDDTYSHEFNKYYLQKMREKLGLFSNDDDDNDRALVESFLDSMQETGSDFTNTFRSLSSLSLPACSNHGETLRLTKDLILKQCCTAEELRLTFKPQMDQSQFQVLLAVVSQNPEILERIGKGLMGLKREIERREKFKELEKMTDAEKQESDAKIWDVWLQSYCERLRKETERKNENPDDLNNNRVQLMNNSNPRVILRNYIAQEAIEQAENGNFNEVRRILKILETPYSDITDSSDILSPSTTSSTTDEQCFERPSSLKSYEKRPPAEAIALRVT